MGDLGDLVIQIRYQAGFPSRPRVTHNGWEKDQRAPVPGLELAMYN